MILHAGPVHTHTHTHTLQIKGSVSDSFVLDSDERFYLVLVVFSKILFLQVLYRVRSSVL